MKKLEKPGGQIAGELERLLPDEIKNRGIWRGNAVAQNVSFDQIRERRKAAGFNAH